MKFSKPFVKALALSMFSGAARAEVGSVNIGSAQGGAGFLSGMISFLQDIVNTVGTTGSVLILFVGVVVGLGLWAVAAKAGNGLGIALRACIAAIGILCISVLVMAIKEYASEAG